MLRWPLLRLLAAACAALLVAACGTGDEPRGPLVLAPSSMQEALLAAGDAWAAEGHPTPVLSFAGTPAQARQLIEGAPADLFISADEEWMDRVAQAGRIVRSSREDIAGNRLVLVAPADRAQPVELDRQAMLRALGDDRLAMADPAGVPAGRYAEAALASLGLWPIVEDRLTASENVRAALTLVERGEAPLGLVYASDAQASEKVVVVAELPSDSHPPILYPAALVAGSTNEDAAGFHEFLRSPDGHAILMAHGFTAR